LQPPFLHLPLHSAVSYCRRSLAQPIECFSGTGLCFCLRGAMRYLNHQGKGPTCCLPAPTPFAVGLPAQPGPGQGAPGQTRTLLGLLPLHEAGPRDQPGHMPLGMPHPACTCSWPAHLRLVGSDVDPLVFYGISVCQK
jgi:hypothetical protein